MPLNPKHFMFGCIWFFLLFGPLLCLGARSIIWDIFRVAWLLIKMTVWNYADESGVFDNWHPGTSRPLMVSRAPFGVLFSKFAVHSHALYKNNEAGHPVVGQVYTSQLGYTYFQVLGFGVLNGEQLERESLDQALLQWSGQCRFHKVAVSDN